MPFIRLPFRQKKSNEAPSRCLLVVFGSYTPHRPLGITHILGSEVRHYRGALCQNTPVPRDKSIALVNPLEFHSINVPGIGFSLSSACRWAWGPTSTAAPGRCLWVTPTPTAGMQLAQQQPKTDPSLSICGHAASLHPTGAPCSAIHAYTALLESEKQNEMQSIPN